MFQKLWQNMTRNRPTAHSEAGWKCLSACSALCSQPFISSQPLPAPIHINPARRAFGFVLVLIYLLYPARATGSKHKLAWYDGILAAAGAAVCAYIVWNYDVIVLDAGPPTEMDFIFGCASILLVLEATRRIVGLPITLVAVVFLLYAKFGNLIPGMMGHPGFSVKRIVGHMYLTTEGLFGMPLGVSASFVFLFILFGAFLHSTGLGKFFIDLALAAAGRYVGGPAKVAVLASGFFGTISGSSVANTVSTGTFTIPLMKSVGYRGSFAGAVEAASSTGGQIMPPIMALRPLSWLNS